MVEFALVAPLFFFVLLAAMDGGLMMYTVNSAAHSTGVGMVVLADEGTAVSADADAISKIQSSGLGVTSLAFIDEIDIYRLEVCAGGLPASVCGGKANGTQVPDPVSDTAHYNRYCYNGTCTTSAAWLSTQRFDSAASLTNIGLTVRYHFNYFGMNQPTANLFETRYFRLEPRSP